MICPNPKCRVKIADSVKYCPRCGEIFDHSNFENCVPQAIVQYFDAVLYAADCAVAAVGSWRQVESSTSGI